MFARNAATGRRNRRVHAIALIVVLAACTPAGSTPGGQRKTPASIADGTVLETAPADTLSGGCTGGVTGGGGGVAVTGRGEILKWSQDVATVPVEFTAVRTDSAAVAAIFAEAERIGFRTIVHRRPFNVTCFLALADSAGRHSVAWPMGDVPPVVRELNRRLHALASR
jgi:hypothetical protein